MLNISVVTDGDKKTLFSQDQREHFLLVVDTRDWGSMVGRILRWLQDSCHWYIGFTFEYTLDQ